MSQADDEELFWGRLVEMPLWEAEQELVARRCNNSARISEIEASLMHAKHKGQRQDAAQLGHEKAGLCLQSQLIRERLAYIRRLQDRLQWKDAVKELFGQDAFEQCAVHIEIKHAGMLDQRRRWAKKEAA